MIQNVLTKDGVQRSLKVRFWSASVGILILFNSPTMEVQPTTNNQPTENKMFTCVRCSETKPQEEFNTLGLKPTTKAFCKGCYLIDTRERKVARFAGLTENKCGTCKETKPMTEFGKMRTQCRKCETDYQRNRYQTNEKFREEVIKINEKSRKGKQAFLQEQKEQGIEPEGEKTCSKCAKTKHVKCFRFNRLTCRDCERDNPTEKFKRNIRSRIHMYLKDKTKHTIEYLGCNYDLYFEWMFYNNFSLETHGKEWHIDHVIPLCHFDKEDPDDVDIAFNWRNTSPLSIQDNLSKNRKISVAQVQDSYASTPESYFQTTLHSVFRQEHWTRLVAFHEEKNIEMPPQFTDLFAKHLDAGNPLEPPPPLVPGNLDEELG